MTSPRPNDATARRHRVLTLLLAVGFTATFGAGSSRAQGDAAGPPASRALTPENQRITDEAIAHDLGVVDGWQRRLDALATNDHGLSLYHRVKADAWLAFARQQYQLGDRCGAVPAALDEGAKLIALMEKGEKNLPMDTPLPARESKVRPDLWELSMKIEASPGFPCAEAEVASLQMLLVEASHEALHEQPCETKDLEAQAEVFAAYARANAEVCALKPVAVMPSPKLPPPAVREPQVHRAKLQLQMETLPKYVHFALDRSDLTPKSMSELDQIADAIREFPEMRVDLSGHADPRGSVEYNLRLSKRRAQAVWDYLTRTGVPDSSLTMEFFGKSRPRVEGETIEDHARNRCVIFTYYTPDSLPTDFLELPTEADLQIEDPNRTPKKRP